MNEQPQYDVGIIDDEFILRHIKHVDISEYETNIARRMITLSPGHDMHNKVGQYLWDVRTNAWQRVIQEQAQTMNKIGAREIVSDNTIKAHLYLLSIASILFFVALFKVPVAEVKVSGFGITTTLLKYAFIHIEQTQQPAFTH